MRRYFAAFAGFVAAAGLATAQAPQYTPAGNLANAPAAANNAYTPAGNFANPQARNEVIQVGCSDCGPTTRQSVIGRIGGGCAMPVGCSNLAAERTFLFGSCRQFFNAGSDCGCNAFRFGGCNGTGYPGSGSGEYGHYGNGYGGCNSCGGGGRERHPCAGVTSYLNR